MRTVALIVVVAAVAGFGWVLSLPSKAECIAGGRVVDPTERHCEDGGGYQQLQEHALFHSGQVVLGAGVLLGAGYGVHRYRRRPSQTA